MQLENLTREQLTELTVRIVKKLPEFRSPSWARFGRIMNRYYLANLNKHEAVIYGGKNGKFRNLEQA